MAFGARVRSGRALAFLVVVGLLLGCTARAWAGGARFIAGQGWGVYPGTTVVWATAVLPYFTDPGDLSPYVPHAQADAMVAAAAAVWSVPTSSISYTQAGQLAEHVSTANTYFDGTQLVFPADVQPANEANIPVAIVYDTDGSLIDLLLGSGASEPDGCRQNAVVGDVDDIHQNDGQIHHATLLLNGRCVGPAPEQLTQVQYQLARAFGRVLGVSWSQTNDNVFTAQTTVTANQMAFWPLMHPIDVVCGNYTYQCMTNPFTLRVDDLNSLAQLYLVREDAVPAGKQATSDDALWYFGILYFPTGQGMDWMNVTSRRQNNGADEDWQTTSSITGYDFQQAAGTPLNPTPAVNSGSFQSGLDGFFSMRRIPLNGLSNVFFTTEPINPLYTGDYAVGPYVRPPVTPSGSPTTMVDWSAIPAGDRLVYGLMTVNDAAPTCNPGGDGTEAAPATPDGSGWQTGLLCAWGHSSWWNMAIAAGHSWTLEVTATDETGAASTGKAQPVLGLWNAADSLGTPPTVASQAAPFNSMSVGMTQVRMDAPDTDSAYRISVTDQYGAGRPDFTYTARFLYAASVAPATVGAGGGQVVITGSGFRQGNQVLVNGAAAQVVSWSPTQIIADAPRMTVAGAQVGVPVGITVLDAATGGSATIPNALSYTAQPNVLQQVSAPGAIETGITAAVPFAVRLLASDGLSPVAGGTVSFAIVSGAAQLGLCGGQPVCTGVTNSDGVVATTVTGGGVGQVVLQAVDTEGTASLQLVLVDTDPVRAVSFDPPAHYVAAGASATWAAGLETVQDGLPAAGVVVTWTASQGLLLSAVQAPSDGTGRAQIEVSEAAVAAGSVQTVTGCAWSSLCATWSLYGVDASEWVIGASAGAGQSVAQSIALNPVTLVVTDLAGHVLDGAPVQVFQRVLAWEGDCPGEGRCAAAPVLAATQTTLISDANGQVQVAPLQVPGVPQVVEVAASTGTQGFLTLTLVKTP